MKKHEPLYILAIHYIDGRLAYRVYRNKQEAERRRTELRQRPDIAYTELGDKLKIFI